MLHGLLYIVLGPFKRGWSNTIVGPVITNCHWLLEIVGTQTLKYDVVPHYDPLSFYTKHEGHQWKFWLSNSPNVTIG